MGIQINGQTDSISAIDGSLTFSTSSVQQVADINATGIITAASANFTGNVSVGGTLTYQDVTNIDSVGVITARAGVDVNNGHIVLDSGYSLQWSDSHERIEQSDGKLEFFTNNTEKVTISGSSLGINRTTPVAPISARRTDAGGTGTNGVIAEFANSSGYGVWFGQSSASGASWGATTGDFYWNTGGLSSQVERLRITSDGTIKCGTSSTLKAEINNAVSGHQFISQCSDNNNGFEVYQQHASNTTRNNFAVYANTGSGNAKDLQFSVRGDGCVTKPNNPAFLAGRTGGNQTFTVGTFPLNLARINVGNCWNTSTYKFTAPVAGIYYFFASVYYNDGAGQHRIHFRKTPNGGTAFQLCTVSHQAASNDDSKSMSIVESMAVGDTMELYSDQNAAVQCFYNLNNTTYGAHTYMMGYLIG